MAAVSKWLVKAQSWGKFTKKHETVVANTKLGRKLPVRAHIPLCVGNTKEELPQNEIQGLIDALIEKNYEYKLCLYPSTAESLKAWFEKNKNLVSKLDPSRLTICPYDDAILEDQSVKPLFEKYKNWKDSNEYKQAKHAIDLLMRSPKYKADFDAAVNKDIGAYRKKHSESDPEACKVHAMVSAIGDLSTRCLSSIAEDQQFFTVMMYKHDASNIMKAIQNTAAKLGYLANYYAHVQYETVVQMVEVDDEPTAKVNNKSEQIRDPLNPSEQIQRDPLSTVALALVEGYVKVQAGPETVGKAMAVFYSEVHKNHQSRDNSPSRNSPNAEHKLSYSDGASSPGRSGANTHSPRASSFAMINEKLSASANAILERSSSEGKENSPRIRYEKEASSWKTSSYPERTASANSLFANSAVAQSNNNPQEESSLFSCNRGIN